MATNFLQVLTVDNLTDEQKNTLRHGVTPQELEVLINMGETLGVENCIDQFFNTNFISLFNTFKNQNWHENYVLKKVTRDAHVMYHGDSHVIFLNEVKILFDLYKKTSNQRIINDITARMAYICLEFKLVGLLCYTLKYCDDIETTQKNMQILIEYGADFHFNDSDYFKETFFSIACGRWKIKQIYGQAESKTPEKFCYSVVIEHFTRTAGEIFDEKYYREWHQAVRAGNLHYMKPFIDAKIDVNHQNDDGDTALDEVISAATSWMAGQDKIAMLKLLLDAGANVNQYNRKGESLLYRAICFCSTDIITLLINAGAKVNTENFVSKQRALHRAAMDGNVKNCEVLIENGADINAQDQHGCSALYYIVECSHGKQLIDMFLNAGADTELKDSDGRVAAQMTTKPEIIALLKKNNSVKTTISP